MSRPASTRNGRSEASTVVQLIGDEREAEDDDRRPADRPDETTDLRERAGTEAEERSEGDQQDRDEVQRVHRPDRRTGAGFAARRRALTCSRRTRPERGRA